MPSSAQPQGGGTRDPAPFLYLQLLLSHKWLLGGALLAGGLAALGYSLLQPPTYWASTTLELQDRNENFLDMRTADPTSGVHPAESYLDTQVAIIQSRSLVAKTVDATTPASTLPAQDDRRSWFGGLRDRLRARPVRQPSPREKLIEDVRNSLQIHSNRMSRIIEIGLEGEDPEWTARFVNSLAQHYIRDNAEKRWEMVRQNGDWLGRQVAELKERLQNSENELQQYATEKGLLFTNQNEVVDGDKLRQLQQAYTSATAERVSKQSQFELLKSSPIETLGDVVDNPQIREKQLKLAELRQQVAKLTPMFKPDYYQVKELQSQIAELESGLQKDKKTIASRIQNDFEAAGRRETMLATAYRQQAQHVSDQTALLVRYNILKHEVESNRQVYDTLLQRSREVGVLSALRNTNIRVIDTADTPFIPAKPKVALNTIMGALSGLMFGATVLLGRAAFRRSFVQPGDVAEYLELRELGAVPDLPKRYLNRVAPVRNAIRSASPDSSMDPQLLPSASSDEEQVWGERDPWVADSFRAILASITLRSDLEGSNETVIVVTSSRPQEGKTTLVSNLGCALAEAGKKVLLIDGDLRNPRLHEMFGVENRRGLADLLCSDDINDGTFGDFVVSSTNIPGLSIIPAGTVERSTTALLRSPKLQRIFRCAQREFDFVVVDTPPLILPDARLIARACHIAVLAIRANSTVRSEVRSAVQILLSDGTSVLGTVLTGWKPSRTVFHSYRRYYPS